MTEETETPAARGASRRYFPGWTMLGVAATTQYLSAPGQSYSVAAFKNPMRETLSLSETDFSLAYCVATVLSACLLPFVGRLVDRFGARIMLPIIASGLGAGCYFMSTIDSLSDLYIGFGLVRSLGQGALSLVSVWLVGEWFERRRGIATAIAGLGGSLSVMTIPLLNNWLIETYGWQTAWITLALAVWGILIIPGIALVVDRPEDIGLRPDGISDNEQANEDTSADDLSDESELEKGPLPTSESWSVKEVLRDKTFWKLLTVPSTAGLVGTGLIFHQVKLLGQHGFEPGYALGLMAIQAGFATCLAFPAGWATDRFPNQYILAGAMLSLASATVLVMFMPFQWLAIVYALLLGLHGSIMRSTANVIWINYYGRAHQGAVRGVAWSAMILASSLGPLPLALCWDHFQTYEYALWGFLAMPIMAACVVWTASPPVRVNNEL
jgi:MFS family permease